MAAINRIIPATCEVKKSSAILPAANNFNGQKLVEFSIDPRLSRRKVWMFVTSGGAFSASWKLQFFMNTSVVYQEEFLLNAASGTGIGDNCPAFSSSINGATDSYLVNANNVGNPPVLVCPMIFDPLEATNVVMTGIQTTQPGGFVIFWALRIMSLAPL